MYLPLFRTRFWMREKQRKLCFDHKTLFHLILFHFILFLFRGSTSKLFYYSILLQFTDKLGRKNQKKSEEKKIKDKFYIINN